MPSRDSKKRREAVQEELKVETPKPIFFEDAEVISVDNWKPAPAMCDESAPITRREQRYDRYQQVMALYEQGLGFTEIQSRVGLSRRTIEPWIKEGGFPEAKRRSAFDPYAHYVLSRWEQGCTNGLQLYRESLTKRASPGECMNRARCLLSPL